MSQCKTSLAGPALGLLFALAAAIAGLAGGVQPVRAAATGTAVTIYVTNEGSNTITIYAPGSTGNAVPSTTITGPDTQLSGPLGVCVDSFGDIFAANFFGASVTEYGAAPSGQTAPVAMISGSNAALSLPFGVALDPAQNIYVTNRNNNTVTEYLAGANNNIAPINTIGGTLTKLSQPSGIAIDQAGNVYVTNTESSTVAEFATNSSGNVAPSALVSGAQTGLNNPVGIALDSAGNLYVANYLSGSISEYAAGSTGNATPMATISGAQTGLDQPYGVAVDQFGNIYVANVAGNTVTEYGPGSNGDAAPIVTLTGAAFSKPGGIAVAPYAGGSSTATPTPAAGSTPTPTPAPGATPTGGPTPIGLSVSTDSITFLATGTDTKSAPIPVLIENSGPATLQVNVNAGTLLMTDAFTVKNAGSFKLAPNHTRTVTIQFTPPSAQTFATNLNVTASNSSPEIFVAVTGTAQSGTLSAPAALTFGTIPARSSLTETLTIQNTGLGVLHGKVVASGFAKVFHLLSGGGAFELSDGARHMVKVKFTPTSSAPFNGVITITSDDAANPSQVVAVSGTGS